MACRKDSLIKLSTCDTKWLEDKIDPLSKILAKGTTAEEKEILGKPESIPFQSEEFSEMEARILTGFPEARWMKEHIQEKSIILKEIRTLQETGLSPHKIQPQDKPDTPQKQKTPLASSLTLIDLTENCQSDDKIGSVSIKLKECTSGNLPELTDSFQGLSMNLGHPNEPLPLQFSPDPSNMSENHNPAPPTVAEAYVASQHGQHLLDTLSAFSEELVPLLLSTSQARLMGIGLEQESSNAFAEIVARDAQLSLIVNNEDFLLEGDVYLVLQYPHADLQPWNALISSHSTAPTMHSSMSSTWISSPDIAQFGNSDHVLANSAASTTNVPFLELSLLREPGALEEAPVLTSTISLSTLHSDKPENIKSMAQIRGLYTPPCIPRRSVWNCVESIRNPHGLHTYFLNLPAKICSPHGVCAEF